MKDELIHEDFLNLESSILSSIEKMLLKINNIVINNFEEDLENFKKLNEELIKLKENILTANEPYGIDNCSRLKNIQSISKITSMIPEIYGIRKHW